MIHLRRTSDEKRPGRGRQRINPREFATTGPRTPETAANYPLHRGLRQDGSGDQRGVSWQYSVFSDFSFTRRSLRSWNGVAAGRAVGVHRAGLRDWRGRRHSRQTWHSLASSGWVVMFTEALRNALKTSASQRRNLTVTRPTRKSRLAFAAAAAARSERYPAVALPRRADKIL